MTPPPDAAACGRPGETSAFARSTELPMAMEGIGSGKTYTVSDPFVLGTPGWRGSCSAAMRSDRAAALNTPSAM